MYLINDDNCPTYDESQYEVGYREMTNNFLYNRPYNIEQISKQSGIPFPFSQYREGSQSGEIGEKNKEILKDLLTRIYL